MDKLAPEVPGNQSAQGCGRPARLDWRQIRGMINLAEVATDLLGPPQGRRGERGSRLWWACPFHPDKNPSFCIRPGDGDWRCFGCGAHGDAAALVMKLRGMTFPEAAVYLADGVAPSGTALKRRGSPPSRPAAGDPPRPLGLPAADALALVAGAERRLWTPEGTTALAYLRNRGLSDATIRAGRLGFTWSLALPGHPRGITLPWFDGPELMLVKIRQPDVRMPKYREVFRARRPGVYPGRGVIHPGRPMVIVEGEFDALLLGQELADTAAVVTLGSASARPDPAILGRMLMASPWYIASDNDPAGDKAAEGWPSGARRVRPPGPFKDWTEAKAGGVDLRRWWDDILSGVDRIPLFTWEELSRWRWGPAIEDDGPGIVVDRPDRARMLAALTGSLGSTNPKSPPADVDEGNGHAEEGDR